MTDDKTTKSLFGAPTPPEAKTTAPANIPATGTATQPAFSLFASPATKTDKPASPPFLFPAAATTKPEIPTPALGQPPVSAPAFLFGSKPFSGDSLFSSAFKPPTFPATTLAPSAPAFPAITLTKPEVAPEAKVETKTSPFGFMQTAAATKDPFNSGGRASVLTPTPVATKPQDTSSPFDAPAIAQPKIVVPSQAQPSAATSRTTFGLFGAAASSPLSSAAQKEEDKKPKEPSPKESSPKETAPIDTGLLATVSDQVPGQSPRFIVSQQPQSPLFAGITPIPAATVLASVPMPIPAPIPAPASGQQRISFGDTPPAGLLFGKTETKEEEKKSPAAGGLFAAKPSAFGGLMFSQASSVAEEPKSGRNVEMMQDIGTGRNRGPDSDEERQKAIFALGPDLELVRASGDEIRSQFLTKFGEDEVRLVQDFYRQFAALHKRVFGWTAGAALGPGKNVSAAVFAACDEYLAILDRAIRAAKKDSVRSTLNVLSSTSHSG